jgi:hypothetical protein
VGAVIIDREASVIDIDGQRFPAAVVVCPPHANDPDEPDWERSLGCSLQHGVYIPAENGVLFIVQYGHHPGPGTPDPTAITLSMDARTCYEETPADDRPLWLPHSVELVGGDLIAIGAKWTRAFAGGVGTWSNGEPEWVAETIRRLSVKPLTGLDGPQVQLFRLDQEPKEPR